MPEKKKDKDIDLKHMFRHACAFIDCARACELEPHHIELRTASHLTANMVNSGLACEIFLKALLISNGVRLEKLKNIHELKYLWKHYKKLDEESANTIEHYINNAFFKSKNELFDKMLDESSRAFVDWRYIYEYKEVTFNPHFLRGFRFILREIACQKIYGINWNEYKTIDPIKV